MHSYEKEYFSFRRLRQSVSYCFNPFKRSSRRISSPCAIELSRDLGLVSVKIRPYKLLFCSSAMDDAVPSSDNLLRFNVGEFISARFRQCPKYSTGTIRYVDESCIAVSLSRINSIVSRYKSNSDK